MKTDLIVVGGGILGVFHAYHALMLGKSVRLIEKNQRAMGATVRNFGQVVPSGMNTTWQVIGRRSLEIYRELQEKCSLDMRQEGSLYIASDPDEVTLIDELAAINASNHYPSERWDASQCRSHVKALKPDYVKGGLYFPGELSVAPDTMIHQVTNYLEESLGLMTHFGQPAIACEVLGSGCQVTLSDGTEFQSEKVIISNGSDFKFLFPHLFLREPIEVTKLQMMSTRPISGVNIPGNILTGLSIRRYEAFYDCPSFSEVKSREDSTELWKKYGVHILFKQASDGSVIIGDSHLYADIGDEDRLGFDSDHAINRYIINEARKIMEMPDLEIDRFWYGVYSQHKEKDLLELTIDSHIHICTAIGGKGMTGSPGYAEKSIKEIYNI